MSARHNFWDILERWKRELAHVYDDAEIRSIFRIALEDVLDLSDAVIKMRSDEELSTEQNVQMDEVLERLKNAEPIQYIAGFTFFDDLKISVSKDVLIPRPETEELVHWIVDESAEIHTILDVCTGSGCIATALKSHFPLAIVSGTDISESALALARKNASENCLEVNFIHDNALESKIGGTFDVIVSNPPYVPVSEKKSMHSNVVKFEPELALFVEDEDPLIFYRAITDFAAAHLVPQGSLYFELHENYALPTAEMVKSTNSFHAVEIRLDLQGKSRMLKAVKS